MFKCILLTLWSFSWFHFFFFHVFGCLCVSGSTDEKKQQFELWFSDEEWKFEQSRNKHTVWFQHHVTHLLDCTNWSQLHTDTRRHINKTGPRSDSIQRKTQHSIISEASSWTPVSWTHCCFNKDVAAQQLITITHIYTFCIWYNTHKRSNQQNHPGSHHFSSPCKEREATTHFSDVKLSSASLITAALYTLQHCFH